MEFQEQQMKLNIKDLIKESTKDVPKDIWNIIDPLLTTYNQEDEDTQYFENFHMLFTPEQIQLMKTNRYPDVEEVMASHPFLAYCYAAEIIEGRWIMGEPMLLSDPVCFELYIEELMELQVSIPEHFKKIYYEQVQKRKQRQQRTSKNINESTTPSSIQDTAPENFWLDDEITPYEAAESVHHFFKDQRYKDVEEYILTSPRASVYYASSVLKERWPVAEPIISLSPKASLEYVEWVLKKRWPRCEPAFIRADRNSFFMYPDDLENYINFCKISEWPELQAALDKNPKHAAYSSAVRQMMKWRAHNAK